MEQHLTPPGQAAARLDLRVLRFRADPRRDEPAMLAAQLLATGRTEEALELTTRSLERDPTDADLLLTHGLVLAEAGQLETAQLAFMQAAKLAPEWAEPWGHLAAILLRRGKPERALQVAERGLGLSPDDPTVRRVEREARLELRAREFLDRGFLDLASGEEPSMLAQELLATGRSAAAFEVTRHALVDEIDDADLLVTHARAAIARGNLQEATSALRMATYEAPEWPEAWRLLAEVLFALGDPGRARDALEKALRLDPTAPALHALSAHIEGALEAAL